MSAPDLWLRQFPGRSPIWGKCRFVFDPDEPAYDWLVVYDDFPRENLKQASHCREALACPREHTLLVTTEPSSIKTYGSRYVSQFGFVLTSQSATALPHPGAIRSACGLRWFYGAHGREMRDFDTILKFPPLDKSRLISTICSSKRQRHTLHHRRYHFISQLEQLVPDLQVFGRTERISKEDALDAYRYYIAVENYSGEHYWTEYLSDAFLGCTLPFYSGCQNATDYFPEGSFIPIDIFDPPGAARVIRAAIENNEYEKRLPLILEARRRVLYEYNHFAMLSRLIEQRHSPTAKVTPDVTMMSRHALRAASPLAALEIVYEKVQGRLAAFKLAR